MTSHKQELLDFYEQQGVPEKIAEADTILATYDIATLAGKLQDKYGSVPEGWKAAGIPPATAAPHPHGDRSTVLDPDGDPTEAAALALFQEGLLSDPEVGLERLITLTSPFGVEYVETTALKFLRARGGDVKKATVMVKQTLELRQRLGVDTILSRPLSDAVQAHFHRSYDEGWLPMPDKQGRLIYVLRGGKTGENMSAFFARPEGLPEDVKWGFPELTEAFIHCE